MPSVEDGRLSSILRSHAKLKLYLHIECQMGEKLPIIQFAIPVT